MVVPSRTKNMGKRYAASDGKIVLTLESAPEGGYVVTSPVEPELITEAQTVDEAFANARHALRALARSRAKRLRSALSRTRMRLVVPRPQLEAGGGAGLRTKAPGRAGGRRRRAARGHRCDQRGGENGAHADGFSDG
jgi:hypothetical protein